MRQIKILESASRLTVSLGISATLIGGSVCLIGLGAIAIVKREAIAPHKQTIDNAIVCSTVACRTGFLMLSVVALSSAVRKYLSDREIREINEQQGKQISNYVQCYKCKYFSGNHLLLCAVHPRLEENCADWEKQDEVI